MDECRPSVESDMRARRLPSLGAALIGGLFLVSLIPRAASCQVGAADKESKEKLPGRIYVYSFFGALRGTIAVDPNDHTWTLYPRPADAVGLLSRVAPDARRIAYLMRPRNGAPASVAVADLEGQSPETSLLEIEARPAPQLLAWSPDSKYVMTSRPSKPGEPGRFATWKLAADGSERTKLPFAETEFLADVSADGRWFVTLSFRPPWNESAPGEFPSRPAYLLRSDGTGERLIMEGSKNPRPASAHALYRFCPDGQTIAYVEQERHDTERQAQPPITRSLWLMDTEGKHRRCIWHGTPDVYPDTACWSPDGKWLAVNVWKKRDGVDPGPTTHDNGDGSVEIIDREGRVREHLRLPQPLSISQVDWL
jgi:dipeptidyl aminopeptidase/acylaminoacyl peptidase